LLNVTPTLYNTNNNISDFNSVRTKVRTLEIM
jgi:hypothetical protein